MLGHLGMNNIVTDFINTLSSRQPSRKNDVKEVLMDNRSKAIALLERGFDSIESDYSSTYAVYQSIIAAVCDPTGERLLEGFDKEPVSGRGVQFRVWTDENPNYNDDDIKNGFRTAEMNSLAHMMAKTEIFLKHKISRSLLFASSEITNVRDVHSYNHGVGRTVGFDMHFTGAVMRAFAMSRYYQAMSACIIHLRSQLSGLQNDDGTGSIWDETMIHINTEFTRGAWEEGGSHHNIWGCSDTIITGKMKDGPLVVGDIVTSASSTCTGNGAPVEALGNAVAESKHVYSTIGELMGYEKSRNHPSLLTNSDGTITSAIGLPKNVEQG